MQDASRITNGALIGIAGLILSAGCANRATQDWDAVDALVARRASERIPSSERSAVNALRPVAAHDASARGRYFQASFLAGEPDDVVDVDDTAAESEPKRTQGPLPGLWETIERDVKSLPKDLWSDTKAVYTSTPNLIILGAAYGGSLALQETGPDDTIEASLMNKRVFKEDVADTFGALGNPLTHFGLASLWYLVGQQTQNEKTYEVGRSLFSALIITGLTTTAGKLAAWDDGPNGESFAFPSGHTSSTFAVASVMHEAYGPWVGVPLYALGALVATERLDDGEHYLSDVVMGSVIGLVVGHTVAGEHELEVLGGKIVPYVDTYTGASGLAWQFQF